jgi:hypothetical protein
VYEPRLTERGKTEIKGQDDLAHVARMAFRVLRDVYNVKDFGAVQFKLTLPSLRRQFRSRFLCPFRCRHSHRRKNRTFSSSTTTFAT